jgi:hypothetical protein
VVGAWAADACSPLSFAVQLFTVRGRFTIDARASGAAAAGVVYLRTRSLPLALAAAAAVTAVLRRACP